MTVRPIDPPPPPPPDPGRTCHLCEEPLAAAPVVGTIARGGRPSRRVACSRCGLVQVDPQPSAEELQHYYETAYHTEHGPVPLWVANLDEAGNVVSERSVEPGAPDYDSAIAVMHRSRARFIQRELGLPAGAHILEVGCSDGRTARELERLGYEVDGVEPDPEKAAQALERINGDVFVGFLDAGPARVDVPTDYDAVISFHVLEHFPNPLEALVRMSRLVKPGGHVWAEVPDTMRPSLPIEEHWQWVHLFDFTAETLAALLLRAGLSFVDVRQTHPAHLHGHGRRGDQAEQTFDEALGRVPLALRSGADMAAHLAAALALSAAQAAADGASGASLPEELLPDPFIRWLEGASVFDLSRERGEPVEVIERLLRRGVADQQGQMKAILEAWDQSVDLVGAQSQRLLVAAYPLFEAYEQSDDPETRGFLNGLAMGRGTERERAGRLLAFIGNAMRRKEMSDR